MSNARDFLHGHGVWSLWKSSCFSIGTISVSEPYNKWNSTKKLCFAHLLFQKFLEDASSPYHKKSTFQMAFFGNFNNCFISSDKSLPSRLLCRSQKCQFARAPVPVANRSGAQRNPPEISEKKNWCKTNVSEKTSLMLKTKTPQPFIRRFFSKKHGFPELHKVTFTNAAVAHFAVGTRQKNLWMSSTSRVDPLGGISSAKEALDTFQSFEYLNTLRN